MERDMRMRGWMVAALVAGASAAAMGQSNLMIPPNKQYVPELADIMYAAQVRHQKLYLAGRARNWELASFESGKLRASLAQAAVLYADIPVGNVSTLGSDLEAIDAAITAKNGPKFEGAFAELTKGCNGCHQSMGRSFVVIRVPTDQAFGNQAFAPKSDR
jgi:hypothetical protein